MITLAEKKIKIKCHQLEGYFIRWYHNGWHHWFFYAGDEEFTTKGEWHNTESQTKVKIGYSGLTYNQVRSIRTALFALRVEVLMADGWKAAIVDNTTLKIYDSFSNGYNCEFTITIYAKVADYTPVTPPQNVIVEENLTDLDILRQIRDANPASNLPTNWSEDKDPYTQWDGVYFGKNTELDLLPDAYLLPTIENRSNNHVYALSDFRGSWGNLLGLKKLKHLILVQLPWCQISNIDIDCNIVIAPSLPLL